MFQEIKNSFDEARQAEKAPSLKETLKQTREILLDFLKGGEQNGTLSVRRKTEVVADKEKFDLEVFGGISIPEDGMIILKFTSLHDGRSRKVHIPTHDAVKFELDKEGKETLMRNLDLISKDLIPLLKNLG